MHIYMYTYICICIHMYIYACIYVYMYIHIYIVYVCNQNTMIQNKCDTKLKTECRRVNQFRAVATLLTDTHKYVQTHAHTRKPTHAHSHAHAPTHMYAHTHTHSSAHTHCPFPPQWHLFPAYVYCNQLCKTMY